MTARTDVGAGIALTAVGVQTMENVTTNIVITQNTTSGNISQFFSNVCNSTLKILNSSLNFTALSDFGCLVSRSALNSSITLNGSLF